MKEEQTTFLKDCLADALFKLMKKKPFAKISVDEIADAAGVGRMTYYRHFNEKIELLYYKLSRSSEDYYNNLIEKPETVADTTEHFLKWVYKNKEAISIVLNQSIVYLLLYFSSKMTPDKDSPEDDKFKISFYLYGTVGLIQNWYYNDFKQSPEEVIALMRSWTAPEQ